LSDSSHRCCTNRIRKPIRFLILPSCPVPARTQSLFEHLVFFSSRFIFLWSFHLPFFCHISWQAATHTHSRLPGEIVRTEERTMEMQNNRTKEITKETRYQGPAVTTLRAPPLRPSVPRPPPPPPPRPRCPNFPPLEGPLAQRGCSAKSRGTAGLHLSSASRSPTRHFCFPPLYRFLDPRPHYGLSVFPLVTGGLVSRLVSATVILSGSHHQQLSSGLLPVLSKYTHP